MQEELKGNQHKLDKNKNGKLDAHDFKLLRKRLKTEESDLEEEIELEESFVVKDHQGRRQHISFTESEAKRKAEELTKKTGNKHSVVYTRSAMVAKEEYELDLDVIEEDLDEAYGRSRSYAWHQDGGANDERHDLDPPSHSYSSTKHSSPFSSKKSSTGSKIYHNVPFAKKDDAKKEGMKWDTDRKKWYHTDHTASANSKFRKEEVELGEAIKGWKSAHTDIAKGRAAASAAGKQVHLHILTKAGKESGMSDARKSFNSVEAAQKYHDGIHKLNPGKSYKHNMYVDGKLEKTLGESVETSVTFSQFMTKLEEAKKCMTEKKEKDDDGEEEERDPEDYEEKGEIKITKRADRKTDKLGRKRPQSLANYHTYGDKDDDDSKSMKEDYDLDEGVKSDEESKPSRKRSKNIEFNHGEDDGKGRINQEEVELDKELDEGTKPGQGSKPGWMLKADPELKKKVDAKIALAKARNKSHGDPKAGKSVKESYSFKDLLNRLSK